MGRISQRTGGAREARSAGAATGMGQGCRRRVSAVSRHKTCGEGGFPFQSGFSSQISKQPRQNCSQKTGASNYHA